MMLRSAEKLPADLGGFATHASSSTCVQGELDFHQNPKYKHVPLVFAWGSLTLAEQGR